MSIFLERACRFDGEDTIVTEMSWSSVDPIAALVTSTVDDNERETHRVLFMDNDAKILPNATIKYDHEATLLEWQPNGRVLAIGWGDGQISCWVADGRVRPSSTYSNSSLHNGSITVLKWNPAGKRIISGDKNGLVVVWAVDSRGTLTPTRQYKKKGMITAAVYCTIAADASAFMKQTYSPSFFFGTSKGGLVYADDLGHCADVQQLSSPVDIVMYFEEASRLVIMTRSLMLIQYGVSDDGRVSKISQVKISVTGDLGRKGPDPEKVVWAGPGKVVWAGPGLLAMACSEKMVRLFDVAADEAYNLSLSVLGEMLDRNDKVVQVSFSPISRYLAVGTMNGILAVWRFCGEFRDLSKGSTVAPTSSSDWELHHKSYLSSPIIQIAWGKGQGVVASVTDDGVVVQTEAILQNALCGNLAITQTKAHEFQIHVKSEGTWSDNTWNEKSEILIKGIAASSAFFVIWSGKSACVYKVDHEFLKCQPMGPFNVTSESMAITDRNAYVSEEALFVADHLFVKIYNFLGNQKGAISFSEAEGSPVHLNIKNNFLVVITDRSMIKVIDISSPTRPKLTSSATKFQDVASGSVKGKGSPSLDARSLAVNTDGTRVAVLADHVEGSLKVRHPDPRLHILDRNSGSVNSYDFSPHRRWPVSIFWDGDDDRLLAVETVRTRHVPIEDKSGANSVNTEEITKRNAQDDEENEVEVFVFFATSEHGIMLQDSFARKSPYGAMMGISVPHIFFASLSTSRDATKILPKVMRDFVGLEGVVDDESRRDLIEFSFNLTLGKLDEAHRAIKKVGSASIWENMAQMCVKTRRMDVAEVCLGNMGNARGAAALRDAKKDGYSPEAAIGVLAIQLGLLDDAAKLFREAKRYDLLNRLYQAAGLWGKAVKVAETSDRIHLKTTHYHYAKYLESIGDIEGATKNYEASSTFRTEIPRMLYNLGMIGELEDYINHGADVELLKWWAAYLESKERFDKACKYYSKAEDYLSLVRIECFRGNFSNAADIISDAGQNAAAASFHFARQLELTGDLSQATNYYASSGCYNHAIRLAKTNNLDAELMRFAVKANPSLMLDCATHFEKKGDIEKAIQLYHKGGDIARALDLCFRSSGGFQDHSGTIFDLLNSIATDLGENTSPQTLARCAEFLVQHKQYERAADLYVMANRVSQAIEMCTNFKVNISENLLEKMTPPADMEGGERKEILKELAKALKRQGNFILASKKYTQAGDRVRAIKCLTKSGDTKAVIQFASISRNAEIYTLAANYLQQMNWRESSEIMKSIITFYTKAKAFEQLAGFYDSCAQVLNIFLVANFHVSVFHFHTGGNR
jgi:intraflagellar transport protein 140